MRALALTGSVLYLVLVHAATLTGREPLRVAALAVLVALLLLVLRGSPWLQAGLLLAVAACLALAPAPVQLLLYAPPVLIPLLLGALVARSLRPGRQPVIERIVWHMHGQPATLDADHVRYARAVTVYWCVVFVLMAATNLAVALLAPAAVWSWVGNIGTYLMPPLALVAEYAWRKRVFPVQQYRHLFDYLGRIVRLGPILAAELVDAGRAAATAPVTLDTTATAVAGATGTGHAAPAVRR
jgi:uncharacterized membrane protein